MKIIYDPIYGKIRIEDDENWIQELIETDIFIRLKDIKQLGLCYLEFPNALQNRYTHSLGAYYLAKKLLSRNEISQYLSKIQINTIKSAALLHDIGHGPHSHGFELYLKEINYEYFRHEDFSSAIILNKELDIYSILIKNKINPQHVSDLIQGKTPNGFPKWTSQIISSEIDIDRLDYLLRDEYFVLGATNNTRNLISILERVRVDNENEIIYFDKDDLYLVNDFLYTRYNMYNSIYLSKNVEKWYISLISILKELKVYLENGNKLKDHYNLFHIYEFMFNKTMPNILEYLKMTDITFDLFLTSLKYENDRFKLLVENFEKGIFDNKIIVKNKSSYFYTTKKPIYIKIRNNEYVPYDSISEFSKLFL